MNFSDSDSNAEQIEPVDSQPQRPHTESSVSRGDSNSDDQSRSRVAQRSSQVPEVLALSAAAAAIFEPPAPTPDLPALASDSDTSNSDSEPDSDWHTVDDEQSSDPDDDRGIHENYDEGDDEDLEDDEDDDDDLDNSEHARQPDGIAAVSFGCSHYQRNCRMVAPCCGKEYWCRHCHNEAEETVAALTSVPPTSHTIDRYAVKEVVCAQCSKRQPVSNLCSACGTQFGNYFCSICNFWDHRLERGYYHCHGCGMCRVGGQEKFVHCDECGHCISRQSLEDGSHVHKPGSLKQDCPCCLEDLFTSTRSSQVLPCGHNVHVHCFAQFARSQPWTRCPLCRRTAMSPQMFHYACDHIDREIARTPLTADILAMFPSGLLVRCYDCSSLTQVPWHPFGMKCSSCGSYNTNPER